MAACVLVTYGFNQVFYVAVMLVAITDLFSFNGHMSLLLVSASSLVVSAVCIAVVIISATDQLWQYWCANRTKFFELDLKPVCKSCYDKFPAELKKRLKKAYDQQMKKWSCLLSVAVAKSSSSRGKLCQTVVSDSIIDVVLLSVMVSLCCCCLLCLLFCVVTVCYSKCLTDRHNDVVFCCTAAVVTLLCDVRVAKHDAKLYCRYVVTVVISHLCLSVLMRIWVVLSMHQWNGALALRRCVWKMLVVVSSRMVFVSIVVLYSRWRLMQLTSLHGLDTLRICKHCKEIIAAWICPRSRAS